MNARPYFVLLVKSDSKWEIQFGDYDRQTVMDKQRDYEENTILQTKVITAHTDKQAIIDSMVNKLNQF